MTLADLFNGPGDEAARQLFRDELFHSGQSLSYDETCALTYERMRWLGERVPAGPVLLKDPARLLALLECAAVVSPSLFLAMTIHYCLGLSAVVEFGGDRDDLLDELGSMSSIGTLLATEAGHGNSHSALRTVAEHDPASGGFVLRTPDPGARKFMSNNGLPGVSKLGVVLARLITGGEDRGVFPFVTRIHGVPGIQVEALPPAPLLPLDYALVSFDDVRLPADSLLPDGVRVDGGFHDPLGSPEARLQRTLQIRQNAWIAAAVGGAAVARAATAIALRYACVRTSRSRTSGERPVLGFRPQQRVLFGALAATYALTCLVNDAERAWVDGVNPRMIGLTKAFAGWVVERVAGACVVRSGAHGVFSVNRLADYHGFGIMMSPAGGDSFLVALEAGRTLAEGVAYTPPAVELPEPLDLSAPATWRGLLRAREAGLHAELRAQLATARRRGQSAFEVWDNRQELGRELAEAHVRRLALESLLTAADGAGDSALDPLCALYALDEIATCAGWYVCEGILTAQQVRRLSPLRDTACERILPHTARLVDAFGLTDDLLRAPMTTASTP